MSVIVNSINVPGYSVADIGNSVGHRSITPRFKPRPGYIRGGGYLSLRLNTFIGRSGHLAYPVHKSGRETSIFTLYAIAHTSINIVLILLRIIATNDR